MEHDNELYMVEDSKPQSFSGPRASRMQDTPPPQAALSPRPGSSHSRDFTGNSPFTPSPLKQSTSALPSPYDGLTPVQLKKLKDHTKKTKDQVNLFVEWFTRLTGEIPDHDLTITNLAELLDTKSEVRSFSSMNTSDYVKLNPGEQGIILHDEDLLTKAVPTDVIPIEFLTTLKIYRRNFSRSMEMGARQIIGHFLAYAVEIAKIKFGLERLVVHTEVEVQPTVIPEIGSAVHGPLDYLAAPVAGRVPMQRIMDVEDGADVKPIDPYFTCIEAKKFQTVATPSSKAQLLAQIRALQIQRSEPTRVGALSDGLTWSIWQWFNNGWYYMTYTSRSDEDALLVLRILVHLVAGHYPTLDENAVMSLSA